MCIFSGEAKVEGTNIFISPCYYKKEPFLLNVYANEVNTDEENVMILPFVLSKTEESDDKDSEQTQVHIFKGDSKIFKHLREGFEGIPKGLSSMKGIKRIGAYQVQEIYSLKDASNVFEIKENVMDSLEKLYGGGYGFILAKFSPDGDNNKKHPIIYLTPFTSASLFVPTVHIHDGELKKKEHFDHDIYLVGIKNSENQETEIPSEITAYFKNLDISLPDKNVVRIKLNGLYPNKDINKDLL
jgi:hypothetical protein